METAPEPWLRGPLAGVNPLAMPVFFSFEQVREDLAKHTLGLTDEQAWWPVGRSSLGFQLKHIAGSVDRITTYLFGNSLSAAQLDFLAKENEPGESLPHLLVTVDEALAASETLLHNLSLDAIFEVRTVGRRQLPSTVLGLLVHLAEHTQRHLGQALTISKLLRQPAE